MASAFHLLKSQNLLNLPTSPERAELEALSLLGSHSLTVISSLAHLTMDSKLSTPASKTDTKKQKYHILIIEDCKGRRSIPLSFATYSVGRDPSNTIKLHDRAASRHHFILIRTPLPNQDYLYRVVDGDANGNASLNGILVNGVPCQKRDLQTGDKIKVGEVTTIQYIVQSLTNEEFEWYFSRKNPAYRSIQESAVDPTATMTTILSC